MKKLLVALVAIAALAGHIWFWYSARVRETVPPEDGAFAELLEDPRFDVALWVPYPHQNLAAAYAGMDDPEAFLEALSLAADLPPFETRGFGPFVAPPAREMVIAASDDRLSVAAEVYPTIALVARAAGRLADNPWLSGGEVQLDDRKGRVSWEGRTWRLESGAPAAGSGTGGEAEIGSDRQASLAWIKLRRAASVVPAGDYRLTRRDGGLELASVGIDVPAEFPRSASGPAPVAIALDGRAREGARVAALFEGRGRLSLPPSAVLWRGEVRRWKLPIEHLARLFGEKPDESSTRGWRVIVSDEPVRVASEELVPGLDASWQAGVEYGLWVRPREARSTLTAAADVLAEVPLVGRSRARRWRAWADLLAPFESRETLSLTVLGESGGAAIRVR